MADLPSTKHTANGDIDNPDEQDSDLPDLPDLPELPEGDDFDPDAAPGATDLRALLKATKASVPPPKVDLLEGVQHRLRTRSKGKFYGDAWSTREDNPRSTFVITALVMLVLVALMYAALIPGGITGQ